MGGKMTTTFIELNYWESLSNPCLLDRKKRQLRPTKEASLHEITQLVSERERVTQISFSQILYENT